MELRHFSENCLDLFGETRLSGADRMGLHNLRQAARAAETRRGGGNGVGQFCATIWNRPFFPNIYYSAEMNRGFATDRRQRLR